MGGDNQPRQERQQELEGVLPLGRCNFEGVSERMAGRWRLTRRRTGGNHLSFISYMRKWFWVICFGSNT